MGYRYFKYWMGIVLLVITLNASAGIVKGKITDRNSNEPLVGATVVLEGGKKKLTTAVNLDGSYSFKHVPQGKYTIRVIYTGYTSPPPTEVEVKSENDIVAISLNLDASINTLDEVSVTNTINKESDRNVRGLEKNSDVVQNILSQKAIELSPDVTVANSLQRMSGVSLQSSSSGEGKYAIIRGMDQRYNTTLINGVKIPSPDDRFRYVPMNLFPSDILQRLEVVKALTPNMEGDAVGGVMNMVMKDAPNKQEFKFFVAGGSSTIFNSRPFSAYPHSGINKQSPYEQLNGGNATDSMFSKNNLKPNNIAQPVNFQTGLTYGDRLFHKKLGFLINVSYQNISRGTDQTIIRQYPGAIIIPKSSSNTGNIVENYPQFNDIFINAISIKQQRLAINNKFDYVINSKNKISLYNLYVRMDEFQTRLSSDTDINTNPGNITINTRTSWQIQTIYNSTLHGEHKLSKSLQFNWNAAYSRAKQQVPDLAQYNVEKNISNSPQYLADSGLVKSMNRSWAHNTDQDFAGYANFILTKKIAKRRVEFGFGGLFRHKMRDNFYRTYSLSSSNSTKPQLANIDSVQYAFNVANGNVPSGDPGVAKNYAITEDVAAAYWQAKFNIIEKLQVVGGVRFENTDLHYTTDLIAKRNGKTGHLYYYDILPSIHFKYGINDQQNIRASYFRSLIRPSFVDILPTFTPASETEAYDQQGNPYAKHTTADNYDVRYEYYPKKTAQVLVGAFYKKIYNPIEQILYHYNVTGGNSSPSTNILTPVNIGNFTNYGIELLLTQYIGMFGISANYTYTHSSTTTPKYYLAYDSVRRVTVTNQIDQTRPLQGQAKHICNVALIFKNPKIGCDIQLAYVYTGERIMLVNSFYNLDTWQAPYKQLDLSFTQKIVKGLDVYGKINNLTNAATRFYIKQPYIADKLHHLTEQDKPNDQIFVRKDIFKTNYLFGLRFKF